MTIKESWEAIEHGISRFEGNFQLNDPIDESSIETFKAEFSLELPDALVESLLIHDGETVHGNSIFPWAFCSLERIADTTRMQRQIHGLEKRQSLYVDSIPKGFIRNDIDWSASWLPIMSSEAGDLICDFDPGPNGTTGQVIFCPPIPNGSPREVLAKNYSAFLEKLGGIVNAPDTEAVYGQVRVLTTDFDFSS